MTELELNQALNQSLMLNSMVLMTFKQMLMMAIGMIMIHFMMAWWDKRAGGGFKEYRKVVMENRKDTLNFALAVLGFYYIARLVVLYLCLGLVVSA